MTKLTERINLKAAVAGAAVLTIASVLVPKNARAFIFPGIGNSLDDFSADTSLLNFQLDTDSNTIRNFELSYSLNGENLDISFPLGNLTTPQNCCSFSFDRFTGPGDLDGEAADFQQYSVSFSNGTTDLTGFEDEPISGIFNFIFPEPQTLEQASEVGDILGFVQFEGDFATAFDEVLIGGGDPSVLDDGTTNNLVISFQEPISTIPEPNITTGLILLASLGVGRLIRQK